MNVHKNNMEMKKCHIRTDTTHEDDRERKEMRQKRTRTANVWVNADWHVLPSSGAEYFLYMLTLKLSYVKCHSTSFYYVQVNIVLFMRVLFMRHDAEWDNLYTLSALPSVAECVCLLSRNWRSLAEGWGPATMKCIWTPQRSIPTVSVHGVLMFGNSKPHIIYAYSAGIHSKMEGSVRW